MGGVLLLSWQVTMVLAYPKNKEVSRGGLGKGDTIDDAECSPYSQHQPFPTVHSNNDMNLKFTFTLP